MNGSIRPSTATVEGYRHQIDRSVLDERGLGEEAPISVSDQLQFQSPPTAHSQPQNDHASPTKTRALSKTQLTLLQLATYSLLVFITFWGVLARLALEYIGTFSDSSVFKLIWPQIIGCLVMGIVVDQKARIESVYPPLFTMLGTGFCGSLTTFSSFMFGVFAAFSNLDTPALGRFSGFMSGLALTVITLGMSTVALLFGRHLATAYDTIFTPAELVEKEHSGHPRLSLVYPLSMHIAALAIGPAFYLGAIFLLAFGPSTWRSRATFAIVLGPPGTLLRYQLGRHLNPKYPRFPLGTFIANTLAVLLFAITAILQRSPSVGLVGKYGIQAAVLQGTQDGFCGSLSTISTLVVELRNLRRGDSYHYFGVSWLVSMVILVIVLGSWFWSGAR